MGTCFSVQASDTTIRGLAVNGCTTSVDFVSGSNVRVEGSFLGTDPTGTQRLIDSGQEVIVGAAVTGGVVGGSTPASRNILTACGVAVSAPAGNVGAKVQGNLINLAAAGDALLTPPCPSSTFPIVLNGSGAQILGNAIAGGASGIFVSGSGHTVRGNLIGTDATGTVAFGLSQSAMDVAGTNHLIGGSAPGDGNVIAAADFYQGIVSAVPDTSSTETSSEPTPPAPETSESGDRHQRGGDRHHDRRHGARSGQHRRFQRSGVRFRRDPGQRPADPHPRKPDLRELRKLVQRGARHRLAVEAWAASRPTTTATPTRARTRSQNYPLLITAAPAMPQGSGTHVAGVLNSTPSTTFDVDFYSNPGCAPRPQEVLEGQDYIGSTQVTTDGNGDAAFDLTLPATVEAGARITATATDPDGNTSEFSQRVVFSMTPPSGPPEGGTSLTIAGMLFESGATVTVGGVAATQRRRDGTDADHGNEPGPAAGNAQRRRRDEPERPRRDARQRLGRGLRGRAEQQSVLLRDHVSRLERNHRRLRGRQLLSSLLGDAAADGGLPPEGEERALLRASAVHRNLPGRSLPVHLSPTGSRRSPRPGSPEAAAAATTARRAPSRGSRWPCSC